MNIEKLTMKELLTRLEEEILIEHQLFLERKFKEADEHKHLFYKLKKEILFRSERNVRNVTT